MYRCLWCVTPVGADKVEKGTFLEYKPEITKYMNKFQNVK